MIKMIIFDLDGTLVNTLGGIAGACNHVLKSHGYESKPIEEYMDYVGNGLAMTLFRALPNDKKVELLAMSNDPVLASNLVKSEELTEDRQNKSSDMAIINHLDLNHLKGEPDFDIPELKALINELIDFYKVNPTINSHLYEGIEEVLTYLDQEQIVWGIHTNKTATIAQDVADKFISPTRYVGLKGPSSDVPRKPNPSGSLDLINACEGVSIQEVLYIGDTEVDIETARKLQVPIISVAYGFRKKEILLGLNPDYIVDQPIEIIELIQSLNSRG